MSKRCRATYSKMDKVLSTIHQCLPTEQRNIEITSDNSDALFDEAFTQFIHSEAIGYSQNALSKPKENVTFPTLYNRMKNKRRRANDNNRDEQHDSEDDDHDDGSANALIRYFTNFK